MSDSCCGCGDACCHTPEDETCQRCGRPGSVPDYTPTDAENGFEKLNAYRVALIQGRTIEASVIDSLLAEDEPLVVPVRKVSLEDVKNDPNLRPDARGDR